VTEEAALWFITSMAELPVNH